MTRTHRPHPQPYDDVSPQERQHLLRQARNRRYHEKKKRLRDPYRTQQARATDGNLAANPNELQATTPNAVDEIMSATSTVDVPSVPRPLPRMGPFSIPTGPAVDPSFVAELQALNSALEKWGFGPLAEFKQRVVLEFAELRRAAPDAIAAFIHRQETWIMQGDEILDAFDRLVAGDLFARLAMDLVAQFWKEMTAISFQILYAMAAVEARLDLLIVPVA